MIGIGTRWTDFTTASNTAFRHPRLRVVNINVAGFDDQGRAIKGFDIFEGQQDACRGIGESIGLGVIKYDA